MYYEEKIIDGVLHWRGTPTGAFKPCTPERLTQLLVESRAALAPVEAEVWQLKYPATMPALVYIHAPEFVKSLARAMQLRDDVLSEFGEAPTITPLYPTPPAVREVVMALKLADQFFDGQDGVWEWDDGEPFPASRIRLALNHPSIKPLLEPSP